MGVNTDFYAVTATSGVQLTFTTATPGDGPGEFVATRSTRCCGCTTRTGNPVEFDDNGATDGRNSMLTFTPTTGGSYFHRGDRPRAGRRASTCSRSPAPPPPGLRSR